MKLYSIAKHSVDIYYCGKFFYNYKTLFIRNILRNAKFKCSIYITYSEYLYRDSQKYHFTENILRFNSTLYTNTRNHQFFLRFYL